MDDEMETRGLHMDIFAALRGGEEITISDLDKPILGIRDAGYQSVRLFFKNRAKLEAFIEQLELARDELEKKEKENEQ